MLISQVDGPVNQIKNDEAERKRPARHFVDQNRSISSSQNHVRMKCRRWSTATHVLNQVGILFLSIRRKNVAAVPNKKSYFRTVKRRLKGLVWQAEQISTHPYAWMQSVAFSLAGRPMRCRRGCARSIVTRIHTRVGGPWVFRRTTRATSCKRVRRVVVVVIIVATAVVVAQNAFSTGTNWGGRWWCCDICAIWMCSAKSVIRRCRLAMQIDWWIRRNLFVRASRWWFVVGHGLSIVIDRCWQIAYRHVTTIAHCRSWRQTRSGGCAGSARSTNTLDRGIYRNWTGARVQCMSSTVVVAVVVVRIVGVGCLHRCQFG